MRPLYNRLRENDILTRRYFYPLLSTLPMYCTLPSANPANLPVATEMAQRVLCLPIYPGMIDSDLARIIEALRSPLKNSQTPGQALNTTTIA
ncbi:DegT/DnrJ/EryC1/StrS family aminotransferase [Pseudorhodobacter sp. E13]|uniref:DegT/DnrJ/EryC1/StrS family aminotransferase n=1 Tax=Pseudorhodobacter sp. E13 TaxID=2487931 RepID=UPI00272B4455|nr:DegT/DnrJ/EryC1/StrS family aminotransferase [Pseudorhodobacter sp. E13]